MRSITKVKNLKNKKVILRVDFNVPIKDGKVEDDFRIRKSLPTIKFLLGRGAKITIVTHLGRDGSVDLGPVKKRFFELSKAKESEVTFFDNVRKFDGEEKNDKNFARDLAKLGDIFVNDAFSVSHRKHASVVGLPKYLPSYAGIQLEDEVKNLSRIIEKPSHPFVFILGGAKFSTKMPLIKKYLKTADFVFIGGALANDFLKARGFEIGRSLTDNEDYNIGSVVKNKKIILPIDVLVESRGIFVNKKVDKVEKEDKIVDVGFYSTENLKKILKTSKMVLWNGPLGIYERGGAESSKKLLKALAESRARSVVGGGDTVALVSEMKIEKNLSFVSTGGGATLDFLANGTLPGVKALG